MYSLPDLPYDYDALAPVISQRIMQLHHQNHHQTYVDKLNAALEQTPDLKATPLIELLSSIDTVPEAIRTAIRNHGGGHYNHSEFWQWMSPDGGGEPSGELRAQLDATYGDFATFVETFSQQAAGIFGSGWAWLMPDMSIVTTQNQDNPLMSGQSEPILGLDVWEHAYYLDYTFKRPDYIAAWWKLVNWQRVDQKFQAGR